MSTTSTSSRSSSTTPSDAPLPPKFVLLPNNSSSITPSLLKAVISRELDPDVPVPVLLGLLVSYADVTSVPVETKEVFLARAQALLTDAGAGLWSDHGPWDRVLCELDGKKIVYFVSTGTSDPECTPENKSWYLEEYQNNDNAHAAHTPPALLHTLAHASLRSIIAVPSADGAHAFHLLEQPPVVFPPLAPATTTHSPWGAPTIADWRTLWRAWDLVTLGMIPPAMRLQKPIDLRHKCLFYIGHIPTFADILLSKATGGPPTEPASFRDIFERGIDPHVDNPHHCHNHSAVPDDDAAWPPLPAILAFRDRVRARILRLYNTTAAPAPSALARTLALAFEHEGFHVETLLYMLIQRAGTGTKPPPGFTAPPWALLAAQWAALPAPSTRGAVLGPATVVLGHDDREAHDHDHDHDHDNNGSSDGEGAHAFGWDNEAPVRAVRVGRVVAAWRPVSNAEFGVFLRAGGGAAAGVGAPRSWVEEGGEAKVRTLYGAVPMGVARDWPVLAPCDALAAYAAWRGGRLPTEAELRLFFDTYDEGHAGGANVGFRHWHPVPATTGVAARGGRGGNGGVWEWTGTVFGAHEGFVPTRVFEGYSADFFDGRHMVVLGASYATIPRIAGRRTVRNFYQHNYPYAWVGGRVVYDVGEGEECV